MQQTHRDTLPRWVSVHSVVDVVLETDSQPRHELCTWSDAVAVKVRGLRLDGRELAATTLKVLTDTHDLIVFLTGEQKKMMIQDQNI